MLPLITQEMIDAGRAAHYRGIDEGWQETTYESVYRAMRDADPSAAAERAVVEAALEWNRSGEDERLQQTVDELIRLRAAKGT